MHFKTVLAQLKSKIFSVGQPWWPTFFHIETCWTHIFVLGPPLCSFTLWTTCKVPTSANNGIFLYYFGTFISDSFSTKVCLKFPHWCFFSSEKELFSWTYLLTRAPRRTKSLIFPVWKKILKIWDTIFELIQIEVQSSKNYFNFFLPQEAGGFGNNIEKDPQKPPPKLKKYICYIVTENICSACSPLQKVVFCTCIN